MVEQDSPSTVGLDQVARIVSSYVQASPDRPRPARRTNRHGASSARQSRAWRIARAVRLPPAVPIQRSVQPEYVVCLECGFRGRTLRRHLRVRHGLEVAAYRARWNLSSHHPVTAPDYSARRSAMAKAIGLGRRPAPIEPPPAPIRRGRPRRRPPPR